MRALITLLPLVAGCVVASDQTLEFDDVQGVSVEMSNGDLSLIAGDLDTTRVDLSMGGLTFDELSHEVVDGVLELRLDCGLTCGGDVQVFAPADTWVEASLDNGSVTVESMAGDVWADLGAGDITATELSGAELCLSTSMGSVDAALSAPPTSLTAQVAAGDVTLRVPAGAYALDLSGASVDVSGVEDDPDSDHLISASAGAGSVDLLGVDG